MLNKNNGPLQVPHFDAVLTNTNGKKYTGIRKDPKMVTLILNISYVIYSFIVPNSETGA